MSDEITRVLNNLAVDEQQLRAAYDMPFLAHRQKEAREIIVAIQARNKRLEKVLGKFIEAREQQSLDVQYRAIMQEAKAVLEEGNST